MSSQRTELIAKVKTVISEQLDVPVDKIQESSSIIDDLGADSLAVVELVLALEENFGVTIPDEEAEKIRTVGDVVGFIEARVPAAQQASA